FAVDMNTNTLEAARCWMLMFVFKRHRFGNKLRQFPRCRKRLFLTLLHNSLGNSPSKALLAILSQHKCNFIGAGRIQEICRRHASTGVHAHIKWAFTHETKATFGVIQLWGGYAKIKKYSVKLAAQLLRF